MTHTFALRSGSTRGPAVIGPLLPGPGAAWAALYWNVLTFEGVSLLLIPHSMGQVIAQAMLLVALLLAFLANPGAVIRPNAFLALLTVQATLALTVSIHNEFLLGSTYRAARLAGFVLALWLLSPWWGRADLPLLRAHLMCLRVILASVLLGVVLAPNLAIQGRGRLAGALWPMPPTQVGHYSAVLLGCTVVLWFCRVVGNRGTAVTVVAAGGCLLLTHTRTALIAMLAGLAVAGASLFLGHARVRRTAAAVILTSLIAWTVFSPAIVSWLARGESAQEIGQLTGRAKVWAAAARQQHSTTAELFGTGLGNKSFGGLAIDSNWVATHLELGRLGVGLCVAVLVLLLVVAVTRPAGPRRAVALFLVVYCVLASFTETGLGDASPYLLDLTVAASLLVRPPWSAVDLHMTLGEDRCASRSTC
jgi:hypothetical protein